LLGNFIKKISLIFANIELKKCFYAELKVLAKMQTF
jgi:hypothetical protein